MLFVGHITGKTLELDSAGEYACDTKLYAHIC